MFKSSFSEDVSAAGSSHAHLRSLTLAGCGTLILFLWLVVLEPQLKTRDEYRRQVDVLKWKIGKGEGILGRVWNINDALPKLTNQIKAAEATMIPSGDAESKKWILDRLKAIAGKYNVILTSISTPVLDQDLLPLAIDKYRTATFAIQLESSYVQFTRFLSDIEKIIPYSLVKNLTVRSQTETREPNVAPAKDDAEKLNISLVLVLAFKR